MIQACRFIVKNKAETIGITRKYSPGADIEVLGRAYDELIRIQGFGVNGGMTERNLKVAHDLALQNGQISQAVPRTPIDTCSRTKLGKSFRTLPHTDRDSHSQLLNRS